MLTEQSRIRARIEQLQHDATPFCIATVVRTADATSAKAGAKAVITADGELLGYVGGGCVTGAVKKAAVGCLDDGEPRMIRVKPRADVSGRADRDGTELYPSGCPSGGTVDVFLEPMQTAPQLLVCGTSPVAAALVAMAAGVGWRTALAGGDRDAIDGADRYLADFDLTPLALRPRDAVVVVTQGRHDLAALRAALRSPADYVGMVGSRKKIAHLKTQLAGDLDGARLDALRGPAGLDLGAITPEEIALSIVAEVVAQRRRTARPSTPANR